MQRHFRLRAEKWFLWNEVRLTLQTELVAWHKPERGLNLFGVELTCGIGVACSLEG